MINFCVEPKKPCHKNPIGKLDFEIDKCYSSVYSRLLNHTNDSTLHVSQEERDEWNSKASNSALIDIQNQLNEAAGDGDNSIKSEVLLEVSKQITGAIKDLNLEEYAKKKYVDDAISNIDFNQYITKKDADSTYLNKADYIKFDPTNYYTMAQIQKIIEDSTIGKDYPIQSFTLEHNNLILTQKNGGQFRVALSENELGGVIADQVQKQLSNYRRSCIVRRDSLESSLDSMCSVSINAGTNGSLGGDSITITLPDSELGRDIIIVNSKWNSLTVKVPDGYTLYKSGTSVGEVQMSKYTMAHAIQIGSKAWIIGMMA